MFFLVSLWCSPVFLPIFPSTAMHLLASIFEHQISSYFRNQFCEVSEHSFIDHACLLFFSLCTQVRHSEKAVILTQFKIKNKQSIVGGRKAPVTTGRPCSVPGERLCSVPGEGEDHGTRPRVFITRGSWGKMIAWVWQLCMCLWRVLSRRPSPLPLFSKLVILTCE